MFMVKAVELDIKRQNLAKGNYTASFLAGRDDYGQAAF
jgi:hypothetical protein